MMTRVSSFVIRPAEPRDVPEILRLIRELATYEREPDAVEASEEDLHRVLFPTDGHPTAWTHVAEPAEGGDGRLLGIALWFLTFSTWTGRNGVWLEDLYVDPAHRGSGIGKDLLATLASICVERGYPRLDWTVLNWNEPSLAFYRSIGAVPMDEWTTQRLSGEALTALGTSR